MNLRSGSYTSFGRAFLLVLFALAIGLTISGCKQVQNEMDDYLSAAQEVWGFQGAALVAYDGNVILSKGYGYADQIFQDKNTPQTKFFIGSITKQFTAAAIMLLVQDGAIDLDDPIFYYLSDYPENNSSKITIHDLLTHTSGIPEYTDDPFVVLQRTSQIAPSDIMALFMDKPLEFSPGKRFNYTNSSYIVLGAIIEEVSGQSYEAFLHHRILKPLQMYNSGYARREMGLPQRAEGYTIDEDQNLIDALPVSMSILHTAGALYSTVEDMLKWDQELYQHEVLDEKWVDSMLTPHLGGYGYGVFIDSLYGLRHTYHGGFLDGFNTTFERWPDQKLCVIVFSNEDEAPVKKIAHGLAAIAFGLPYDMPERKQAVTLDQSSLKAIEGIYKVDDEHNRRIVVDSGSIYTWIDGYPRRKLLAADVDSLFAADDNSLVFTFRRDNQKRVAGLIITDEGRHYYSRRLTDEETERINLMRQAVYLDSTELDRFVGEYHLYPSNDTTSTYFTMKIWRDDDHLLVQTSDEMVPVQLHPSSPTEFFHSVSFFRLSFRIDKADRVVGCILSLGDEEVQGRKIN